MTFRRPITTASARCVLLAAAVLLGVLIPGASLAAAQTTVRVENPTDQARPDEVVRLPWDALARRVDGLAADRVRVVDAGGAERPVQVLDADADGVPEALLVLVSLWPGETQALTVEAAPAAGVAPRAQVLHEPARDDVAWENDRVAFRTYGQGLWELEDLVSSGVDVWTKRTRDLVAARWYDDGDYHTDTGEGADFFSVGASLGGGGTAVWHDGELHPAANFADYRVLANGPLRAVVELEYDAWDVAGRSVSETRRITMDAGRHVYRQASTFSSTSSEALRYAVGLVHRDGLVASTAERGRWAWLSGWGPVGNGGHGDLGTAVLAHRDAVEDVAMADGHHLVVADATPGVAVVHYVGAAWTAARDVGDAEAWWATLDAEATRLDYPVRVAFEDTPLDADAALDRAAARLRPFLDRPAEPGAIPRSLHADGTADTSPSREWTSGFYPGTLWMLYEHTGDAAFADAARRWTALVEPEKKNAGTHDMGFKVYNSFGQGLRLTDDAAYRAVVVEAADTLATRYDERVGAIRSWDWGDWRYPVIIDNMMNLEHLFAATRLTGDSTYYRIADRHARTTLAHLFRDDASSFHVVQFDTTTGAVLHRGTHQGYSDASAWSRGQGWALYGYTMAYRETGEADYLAQARRVADFVLAHPRLPGDGVPYWDFDAPGIPDTPRDASAAAVVASALYELSAYVPDERARYVQAADRILASLSQDYLVADALDEPFLLDHSVGSVPGAFEVDVPITYADYYYVEALLRRLRLSENETALGAR